MVQPFEAVGKVNIRLQWYDPDDPSASTGPIDDDAGAGATTDNRGSGSGLMTPIPQPGVTRPIVDDAGDALVRTRFRVTNLPGDNFRVIAKALNAGEGGIPSSIKPIRSNTKGRLFHDTDGNNQVNGADQIIDEGNWLNLPKRPPIAATPLLRTRAKTTSGFWDGSCSSNRGSRLRG